MKIIKKNLIAFMSVVFISLSFNASAGLFGGGGGAGLKKILNVLNKIQKTQTGMDATEIQVLLKSIEQVENQMRSLENDARQLQGLASEVKSEYVDELISGINDIQKARDEIESTLRENLAKLDNISKWFALNQDEYKQGNEWTQEQIKEVEEKVEKMKNDVRKATAKLNAKSKKGYSLRKDDLIKLKEKIKNLNKADGEVAVIQALGHLAGQTNEILIDIKDILRDQNNLIANTEQANLSEEAASKQRAKEEKENNEKIAESFKKQAKKDGRKKIKIDFNID